MQNVVKQADKQIKQHKRAVLYTFFNQLEELEVQSVTMLDKKRSLVLFAEDKRVILNERLLYKEQIFQKYLTWFNQNVQKDLPFYRKKILIYQDCSFEEYIEENNSSIQTDRSYYERLGSLAAIVPALGGKALTEQYVVRSEAYPIIREVEPLYENGYRYSEEIEEVPTLLREQMKGREQAYRWVETAYQTSRIFCKDNGADIKDLLRIYQPCKK